MSALDKALSQLGSTCAANPFHPPDGAAVGMRTPDGKYREWVAKDGVYVELSQEEVRAGRIRWLRTEIARQQAELAALEAEAA